MTLFLFQLVKLDKCAVEGGIGKLVDPITEKSHRAVAVKLKLPRQMNVSKDEVLHLWMSNGILCAEFLKPVAAHLLDTVFFIFGTSDSVLLRPACGDRIS